MPHGDQKISRESSFSTLSERGDLLEVGASVKYPSAVFKALRVFGERGCYEGGCDAQSPDPGPGLDVFYSYGLQQIRGNPCFS